MYENEIVEEIHRIREEYSASLNHDLRAIVADLQKQQFEGDWEEVDLSKKNKIENQDHCLFRGNTIMSDQENLVKRESDRYRILKIFYDTTVDKPSQPLDYSQLMNYLVTNEGMFREYVESAIHYLEEEGLLETPYFGGISITHQGIKEIEASIKNPEQNTKHFLSEAIKIVIGELTMNNNINNDDRGANIANFANQLEGNAQQVASNFSQNINQNIDKITKLIDSLRNMAREFPEEYEEQREEALAHLEDLQEEIATPEKRKPSRIKASAMALLRIASGIAVGTDFLNTSLDLLNKVGVPIDINLPQLIQNLPKS